MCGIYGYIGKNRKIFELVFKSLQILRARGYDSYGYSYFDNKEIVIEKSIDKNLQRKFTSELLKNEGNTIITHTRWATNGKVSICNTHPFMSSNEKFVLVHNGIIENANILKKDLLKDKKFLSNTDSEVIVNLIEYFYEKYYDLDFNSILSKVFEKLKGYWSVLIYKVDEPDCIYVSRNETSLVIGFNQSEIHLSSDSDTFSEHVNKFFEIKNKEILKLKYDRQKNVVNYKDFEQYKFFPIKKTECAQYTPHPYKYWLEKEIMEQPNEINNLITRNNIYTNNNILYFPDFDNNFKKLDIQFSNIYLLGSGTSYHACILGEFFLKKKSEYNTRAYNVSDFSEDDIPHNNTLFIVVSQSGETKDIYDIIIKIKGVKNANQKYRFLSITNSINSLISRNCDLNLYLRLSKEISVASTKTYTCSSLILYILSLKITNSTDLDHLFNFGHSIENQIYEIKDIVIKLINKIYDKNLIFLASTSKNLSIAHESCLKIREICYKWCISSSAKNLKHGPLALIDSNTYVFHFITDKYDYNNSHHVANEINARGGNNIAISTYKNLNLNIYDDVINIDTDSDILNTLMLIIPSQLLTLYLGKKLGYNIDMPKNLAKTVTV